MQIPADLDKSLDLFNASLIRQIKRRVPMRNKLFLSVVILSFLLPLFYANPLAAQAVKASPTISAVVITAPVKSGEPPWRTNKQTVALTFTAVVANGQFVATSAGGDIPFSSFIGQTGSGKVAVGINNEGLHRVQVILSSVSSGGTAPTVNSASASVGLIYDSTPPVLNVTEIKVNDLQGWVPFNAAQAHYSNSSVIGFRGTVVDQYTPSEDIIVRAQGMVTGEVQADSSGRFEISVSTGNLPDGVISVDLVALETMSDGTLSSPSDSLRISFAGK
jgi:hypothetical protein